MVIVLSLALAVSSARAAHAESAEAQVERLASEAVTAYRGADYHRAIELLQRAYDIRQVPALQYNMAKAYDKLGDLDHAAECYRRFVDAADADPKLKNKAEARLAVIEEARRKKAAAQRALEPKPEPKPAPVVEPPKPAVVEPPKPVEPTPEQIRDKLRDERQQKRRRDRWVALGLGIGAVACAGVAIGLSVDALSLQNQWSSEFGGDETARRQLEHDALVRAGVADGFYALTGVTAAVAAYFVYRGFRPEPTAPSIAFAPAPGGAALVVGGRF